MSELNNPGYEIPPELQNQVAITTLDKIYNWGRRSSVWPMMFGLACCAIEMICAATSRFDFARFGMEIMRASHLFCMPYAYEGFGIAILEAMAFGLPAIGCRDGAAGETISHGSNGFLLAADDLAGLAPLVVKELMEKIHSLSVSLGMTVLIVEQNVQASLEMVSTAYLKYCLRC